MAKQYNNFNLVCCYNIKIKWGHSHLKNDWPVLVRDQAQALQLFISKL